MHDLRPNLRPWLWTSAVLCGLGIVVSGYLASKRLTGGSLACTRWAQCDVVNNSLYSKFLGIPVSFIGLAAYLLLLALALAALWTDGRSSARCFSSASSSPLAEWASPSISPTSRSTSSRPSAPGA